MDNSPEVFYMRGALWGRAGGQLEFVSQRTEWRKESDGTTWRPYMIMTFTDHDVQITADIDERSPWYEIAFPIFCR